VIDSTASPHIEKNSAAKSRASREAPTTWPDVLRCLPEDETRSCAIGRYRDAGFAADSFGHRRNAREAMADALTRTEDWLEYREVDLPRRAHLYRAERDAIRDVRRRLEWELYP
jgi:hypothetical protein